MSEILVVGSVAYDSVQTPKGQRDNILGGSANYFSLAASMYSTVRVVGVVGDDYKQEHKQMLLDRKVDLSGLQQVPGKTFRWEGKYEKDMNTAITLGTHLNVFETFRPHIPDSYTNSPYVFLANIDPVLQLQVLEQVKSPRWVGADTMNYWIQSKKKDLLKILERIDVLLINESELRELTNSYNTISSAKKVLQMGPKAIVIKRGEYGFVLLSENQFFILPAFPVDELADPTGAGDTFAGGFFGYLSRLNQPPSRSDLKQACVHGCLLASFTVQDFGVEGIKDLKWADVDKRLSEYQKIIS
jgi:sugar/nucleoside kinase (ribokinase family)